MFRYKSNETNIKKIHNADERDQKRPTEYCSWIGGLNIVIMSNLSLN